MTTIRFHKASILLSFGFFLKYNLGTTIEKNSLTNEKSQTLFLYGHLEGYLLIRFQDDNNKVP
jgi:hypothetical protein